MTEIEAQLKAGTSSLFSAAAWQLSQEVDAEAVRSWKFLLVGPVVFGNLPTST